MYGDPHDCTLGCKTDGHGHPKEECPKPKSWKQLERAKRIEKERAQIMDEKKNQEFPQDSENNEYRY
jgi:hypothetical protein